VDDTSASVEVSVSDPAELGSLGKYLREVPAIKVRQIPGVPAAGNQMAWDVLPVLAVSGGGVAFAVGLIATFIQSRRVDLSVTVKTKDEAFTITAANAKDLMPVVVNALTGVGGEEHRSPALTVDHSPFSVDEPRLKSIAAGGIPRASLSDIPVTIYLADGSAHEEVEVAVEQALAAADLRIVERGNPVTGSWWRSFRAKAHQTAKSPVGSEVMAVGIHAAEQRLVLEKDADITAKLMQNLGGVITALQPEQNAVVRIGAALIVKADGVLVVHQLTPVQQLKLNHSPRLLQSPHDILLALESASNDDGPRPVIGL
jgi:hypothetical protein